MSGCWYYTEYPDQKQTAGSYLFEPGGSVHQFNTPADKNFDYQDVTLLVTNAQPAVASAPALPPAGINLSFNGSISGTVAALRIASLRLTLSGKRTISTSLRAATSEQNVASWKVLIKVG